MLIVSVSDARSGYRKKWPDGSVENYSYMVEYRAISEEGDHKIKIAFGMRYVYGRERTRVLVLIDDYPHAEFFGADDFESSGSLLSEIKIPGHNGERACRYPDEVVPERYTMFEVVGLPVRVNAARVHKAWAVVANVSDHKTIIALASLRKYEKRPR